MAYLEEGVAQDRLGPLQRQIEGMYGVATVTFISRQEALGKLKKTMKRQSSLLTNLKENPLPNAFEIRMLPDSQSEAGMEVLARGLNKLPEVEEVEYGQQWIGRISSVVGLFRLAGYGLGALFFMASVFIVANTIRLVLYSRRQEVEIMQLVGATDRFIKAPFYIEGLILGAVGGAIGQATLLACYLAVVSNVEQGFSGILLDLRFLPPGAMMIILLCSMIVGWLGCFLSLRQFFGR